MAIVDDDASARRGLARLLQSAGYAVETFNSAATFFAALPEVDFACALVDVQMPGLTGLQLQRGQFGNTAVISWPTPWSIR
jgi:FixJ family two-component response regulator